MKGSPVNFRALAAAALFAGLTQPAAAEQLLANLFQDHLVLQRDAPAPVWGRAAPGARLTVSLDDWTTQAKADADGAWSVELPALPAGGPHTLAVRSSSGASQTVRDVLFGDVFLCSGQSNMVLQVHRTNDSRSEILNAQNDSIRMATIPNIGAPTPRADYPAPVEWRPTTPQTVRDFSAACYYFARELQKTVDIPLGLINASWGGARVRSWVSADSAAEAGLDASETEIARLYLSDRPKAEQAWAKIWETWWTDGPGASSDKEPWAPGAVDESWRVVPSIGRWDDWPEAGLANFVGTVWMRTTVSLTPEQARAPAVLTLGGVDEVDQTWVNGVGVGATSDGERRYPIAPGVLHAGDNDIVVAVMNTYKAGGLVGPAERQALVFGDGQKIALDGTWRYKVAASEDEAGFPPRAPWDVLGGLGVIYNGMIAPLGDFALKGAIWYQGESDTPVPDNYWMGLTALMKDWRRQFGEDLPFLIVQLAGYGSPPTAPEESGSAEVREAQRAAAAGDPYAELVVTIDIGDSYDVHPANKQELGRRLARAARHLVYGEDIVPTGPTAVSARREGKKVVIGFKDVEGGLVAHGAAYPIGFELCGAGPGSCRYAAAAVDGGEVKLDAGKPPPVRVRYCWAESPICTLFDATGLPVGPFELPIETARD